MAVTKRCLKCDHEKPADREHWYFSKSARPIGPCKTCRLKSQRERYHTDPQFRVSVCEYQRKRRQDPIVKLGRKEYDKVRDKMRQTDPEFRTWRLDYAREYNRERYRNDPKVNLDRRIKGSVGKCLRGKGAGKTFSKSHILGWTIDELMAHLEALFEPGMSWENMKEWHIDHIIPLSVVTYQSENDPLFKMVWSLSNLAPLWAFDNLQKLGNLEWSLPETYKNPKLRKLYEERDIVLTIFG